MFINMPSGGGGGSPTGAAGGDLGGTYPNPTVVSVANVTTGVLAAANGGAGQSVTTAQSYYAFPYGDAGLSIASSTSGTIGVINRVLCGMFHLPAKVTFNRVSINVTTTSSTNHEYIGIYSADKSTLLVQASFTLGAGTGVLTATVGSTTLNPGEYYLARSADQTTSVLTAAVVSSTALATLNAVVARWGISANSTAAGVMPAALGIISASNANLPNVIVELA